MRGLNGKKMKKNQETYKPNLKIIDNKFRKVGSVWFSESQYEELSLLVISSLVVGIIIGALLVWIF